MLLSSMGVCLGSHLGSHLGSYLGSHALSCGRRASRSVSQFRVRQGLAAKDCHSGDPSLPLIAATVAARRFGRLWQRARSRCGDASMPRSGRIRPPCRCRLRTSSVWRSARQRSAARPIIRALATAECCGSLPAPPFPRPGNGVSLSFQRVIFHRFTQCLTATGKNSSISET